MSSFAFKQAKRENPFITMTLSGCGYAQHMDAESRISAVKSFDADECQAALKLKGLQKTVRQAIQRRRRQLEGKGRAR